MFKSPERFGGNHESDRTAARANGQKVLSAAEAAKQKEREDRLRRMMQAQKAKKAAENNHEATSNATPSSAETLSPTAEQTAQKAKGNSAFKRVLFGVLLGGGIALGAFAGYQASKAQAPVATEATADDADTVSNPEIQEEANPFAGELSNGVSYDYYEYADIENKTSKNAYGYDKSDAFGNREATENAWMDMASKGPEYLASYATHVFTNEEKQSLGIADMSPNQLDDYMSNAENIDGGEKQRNIMAALDVIARDKENTIYEFYYEEGEENTYYITFEDLNNDGNYSPDELKLGYTTKKRNGAPQVDIYRIINGEKVKVLDLNMECGMQPNDEQPPQDLPPIPSEDDDSTGSESTGSESTGSESTGSESTGSESTGNELTPTGAESTGAESTGIESTGAEGTGTEGTGNENTDAKDPAAEIRNAGDHVDQQQLNQDVTPATNVNQDQANHQAIEQQKQQDAAAAAAAAQQRQQQAAAEQAAAQAAEQRRQEQAAAEAAAAEAQAAAEQAAAAAAEQAKQQAAAEQAAAAERAAREQAQREADAQAAAAAAAAASNADNTAEERANDFANGNF